MTTIAVRNGILAADSALTNEGEDKTGAQDYLETCQKLVRVNPGTPREAIITSYGNSGAGLLFTRWYQKRGKIPKALSDADDFGAIVLDRRGLWCYDNWFEPEQLVNEFHAFGTGAKAAYGALHAGCSAQRAVEIACLVDPYTAGPVLAWTLSDLKE